MWPNLRKGYKDEEIFNADETGLFFRITPDKTMKFKGEKCVGGKLSKERLTVLVASNMTGSEKKKLLVIGKAKQPRCFKNVKSLPVDYESNSKAWMTSVLFEKLIRQWDNKIFRQKKKMLLLVDNCPAHPNLENLKAIKLVFLPPNTTSVLQPMDQGVIKSLKTQFRKLQIMKILEELKNTDSRPKKLNVLEAILLVSKAWDRVSQKTISNCFAHAGFHSTTSAQEYTEEDDLPLIAWRTVPLSEWVETLPVKDLTTKENWENFSIVDEDLETEGNLTETEILANLTNLAEDQDQENETNDDDDLDGFEPPSIKETCSAVRVIRNFFTFNQELKERNTEAAISHLERITEAQFLKNNQIHKQTKLTDFFVQL